MKRITKRMVVVLGATVAAVSLAVGAYAYWTTSGSGSGSATTGTSVAVTLSQLGDVTNLVPDGPDQSIDFRIANPASYNQYITSVTVAVDPTWSAGTSTNPCNGADFAVTQPTWTASDQLPGNNDYVGAASGALIHMVNQASNQDDCKSVTVPLVFAAS